MSSSGAGGGGGHDPHYLATDLGYFTGSGGVTFGSGHSSYPGWTYTGITIATGTATVVPEFQPFTTGGNRLTKEQVALLLHRHSFIAMDDGDYCLYCYALDLYRTRGDHMFVIREE